jgi:hypothetical protein
MQWLEHLALPNDDKGKVSCGVLVALSGNGCKKTFPRIPHR